MFCNFEVKEAFEVIEAVEVIMTDGANEATEVIKFTYSVDSIKRTVHLTFHGLFLSIKSIVF